MFQHNKCNINITLKFDFDAVILSNLYLNFPSCQMSFIVSFPSILRFQSRVMFAFVCHISLVYNSSTFLWCHSPDQLFCRLSSSLDLSGSFLNIRFWLLFSKSIYCTVVMYSQCLTSGAQNVICPFIGDVKFGYLVKVVSSRFLHCKGSLIIFLRINSKYYGLIFVFDHL